MCKWHLNHIQVQMFLLIAMQYWFVFLDDSNESYVCFPCSRIHLYVRSYPIYSLWTVAPRVCDITRCKHMTAWARWTYDFKRTSNWTENNEQWAHTAFLEACDVVVGFLVVINVSAEDRRRQQKWSYHDARLNNVIHLRIWKSLMSFFYSFVSYTLI